ncbi:hypothetical protein [Streptomyces sp. NPDC050149]|uniref:hypothetical protein n=1 Tax=unclassified Streptomyces TaxID=2593676 RepID=UPI0037A96391
MLGPFRTGLTRRFASGARGGIAPLVAGQYVLEVKGRAVDGFWVGTSYHLDVKDF